MGKVLQRLIDLIVFYFKAKNYKQIQDTDISAFVYRVLEIEPESYIISEIEKLRSGMKKSDAKIDFKELGAGQGKSGQKTVKEIAGKSLSPQWKCNILFNLAKGIHQGTILELGTSLGISTAYLAAANKENTIHTIEGNKSVSDIAQMNFKELDFTNINCHIGNFDDILDQFLSKINKIDLAFIDGNHCKEATVNYFNSIKTKCHSKSVIIIDDIYWSKDMHEAWQTICTQKKVNCTIDFFQFGIVLFDPRFSGNYYVIKRKYKAI